MKRIGIYSGAVLIGVLLGITVAFSQVLAKQYKTMALGPYSVGIVCLDGSKPAVSNNNGLVLVSCPSKREQ